MKKVVLVVVGVLVVLLVAVAAAPFVVPPLIDWNDYKPRIAEAVRDATGRELEIDGDIELSLLPNLEFSISGLRVSNAPGSAEPEMLSVAGISGKIAVFPLIGRNVVVERLVITEPRAILEVDEAGRPNWSFEAKPREDRQEKHAEAEEGLPIQGLRLGDVRIEKGLLSYRDAATGQMVEAKDIDVTVALTDLDRPFSISGRMTVNDEPVALDLLLDSPGALLAGERAAAKAALAAQRVTASYDGGLRRQPVPGLDGSLALEVPSVGALAAWLGRPLDASQPDPGPLTVAARFAGEGAKVVLEQATIEGEGLRATASGSFDAGGETAKAMLKIESGVLDIDRYLPPPAERDGQAAPRGKRSGKHKKRRDLLASIPDKALDLSALRRTEAEVEIDIGGVKAVGFELGQIAFTASVKDGVLDARLNELRLYGGGVTGRTTLDGSGEMLGIETAFELADVDLGALARAASGEAAPVAGLASGSLAAKARGATPRALIESLSGRLTFDLGGVDVKDAPAGTLSEIEAKLELPGLASPPSLTASAVYNKERVTIKAALDPIDRILAGEAFAARATLASNLVEAGYDGTVLQEPVPGLDGAFGLVVPSVGKLAAWLGQPLDPAQPDPGPLQVKAVFAGDGAKVELKEATIRGTALEAKASGSFDGNGEVAKIVLAVESGVLDIDRYLPAPAKAARKDGQNTVKGGGRRNPLAALPDEPLDLSGLRRTEADLSIAIGGVKAAGFELGPIAFTTQLKEGVLDADLSELALYGGLVKGRVKLDASGDALGLETALTVAGVDLGTLARAATGEEPPFAGIASGTLDAKTRGASPRDLAEGLSGQLALKLDGVETTEAAAGTISALDATLDLPGLDSPSNLKGKLVYNTRQVDLDLTLDPLAKILDGQTFAAKLDVASPLLTGRYDGMVQQQPVPGLDGALDLDVTSLGELATWLGQPLGKKQPDPGPLKLRAALSTDGPRMALEEVTIEGKALKARASGSLDTSGAVPRVEAKLDLQEANLNKYLPRGKARKQDPGTGKKTGKAKPGKWSEEPLDLSALSMADAEVEIRIGKVRYRRLVAKQGLMTVKLSGGVLEAAIERLALAKGSILGAATLDASTPVAAIDYRVTVDGVEARPLVRSFADSDRLSGTATIETEGRARGTSEKELVASLDGAGSFKFLDGAIHGFNLAKTLRSAGTLGLGDSESAKTDFAELSGSFTITKGVLRNRDLKMLAPLVRVTGAGKVPMPPRKVNYTVEAKLVGTLEGQGGQESLKGLPIPVKVTGPWHKVKYKIDWKSVFLAAAADPTRLEAMPDSLRDSAEGLGVGLPIPGIDEGSDVVKTLKKKKKKLKKKLKSLLGN